MQMNHTKCLKFERTLPELQKGRLIVASRRDSKATHCQNVLNKLVDFATRKTP